MSFLEVKDCNYWGRSWIKERHYLLCRKGGRKNKKWVPFEELNSDHAFCMHWGARDFGQFPHCYTFSTCNSFQGLLCKEILKNQYLGLTSKVLWKYLILASTENISVTNSYLIQHSDQFSVQLHAQSYAQNVSREHSPGVDVAAQKLSKILNLGNKYILPIINCVC